MLVFLVGASVADQQEYMPHKLEELQDEYELEQNKVWRRTGVDATLFNVVVF